jgi:hypothetical protein
MSDKKQKQNQEQTLKTSKVKKSKAEVHPIDENVQRLLESINEVPKEIIDRAFKREVKNREIEDYFNAINSVLSEFLSTYALIGYDLENNPVHIFNTQTPKDYNAIIVEMSKVLSNMNIQLRSNNNNN